MSVFDRVKELSQKRGKTIAEVEEDLGFGKNSFYSWKTKSPTGINLKKVADYFNVSTDYLLGRDEKSLDEDLEDSLDNAMLYSGKKLNDVDRATIKALLKGYFDNKED